ncbi:hypothetical protein R1sor_013319 [Riccia sorocarpa]|uniref:Uncharacterized protein n=1 Tax=Riccia sorocarpa TaxID=122646 RepID=A0ABD3H9H1_9MARC
MAVRDFEAELTALFDQAGEEFLEEVISEALLRKLEIDESARRLAAGELDDLIPATELRPEELFQILNEAGVLRVPIPLEQDDENGPADAWVETIRNNDTVSSWPPYWTLLGEGDGRFSRARIEIGESGRGFKDWVVGTTVVSRQSELPAEFSQTLAQLSRRVEEHGADHRSQLDAIVEKQQKEEPAPRADQLLAVIDEKMWSLPMLLVQPRMRFIVNKRRRSWHASLNVSICEW